MPPLRPGKHSTEHARALWAQVSGFVVMAAGIGTCWFFASTSDVATGAGVGLCAIGGILVGVATASYSKARTVAKVAEVSRKPDNNVEAL